MLNTNNTENSTGSLWKIKLSLGLIIFTYNRSTQNNISLISNVTQQTDHALYLQIFKKLHYTHKTYNIIYIDT